MGLTLALSFCLQVADGLYVQFEEGLTGGWSVQNINDAIKWQVDSVPQMFVSPSSSLNNIDAMSGSGAGGVGESTAYSPTVSFSGDTVGGRIFEHWCRYVVIDASAPFYRRVSLGLNLLTEDPKLRIIYDVPTTQADDLAPGENEIVVSCGTADWHKHRFYFPRDSSPIIHNTVPIEGTDEIASAVTGATSLQVSFYFQWNETTTPSEGGGSIAGGIVGWFIDDMAIVPASGNSPIPNPWQPSPGGGGEGGGGGGGGCSAALPAAGGTLALPALLALALTFLCRPRPRELRSAGPCAPFASSP